MSKSNGSRISKNFPASESLRGIFLLMHFSAFCNTSAASEAVKLMTRKPYKGRNQKIAIENLEKKLK